MCSWSFYSIFKMPRSDGSLVIVNKQIAKGRFWMATKLLFYSLQNIILTKVVYFLTSITRQHFRTPHYDTRPHCAPEALSLELKWMEHKAGQSPPHRSKIKNTWCFTSTSLYVFMEWWIDTVSLPPQKFVRPPCWNYWWWETKRYKF